MGRERVIIGQASWAGRYAVKALVGSIAGLLCLFHLSPVFSANLPLQEERFEYRVSYQGALSANARIDICDAVLETSLEKSPVNGEPTYRSSVWISSEDHRKMEQIYPFRYRFLSFYSTDLQRSILFDKQKITRKERHEIVWFDWERGVAERYKKLKPKEVSGRTDAAAGSVKKRNKGMSAILSGLNYSPIDFRRSGKSGLPLPDFMHDRLSLLQAVRSRNLSPGQEVRLSVSDGKTVLNYQVQMLGQERLEYAGRAWDTFKLRFDAYKNGRWSGRPAHPGVFVWLSADGRKAPVRFSVNYALGTFVVQMQGKDILGPVTPSLLNQLSSAH